MLEARMVLRKRLRELRMRARLTQEEVAAAMEWSSLKLLRVEAGSTGISTTDLRALLSLYGSSDQQLTAELAGLAAVARRRPWWTSYRDHVSGAYAEFAGAEAEASSVSYFDNGVLPSILWTRAYADAVMTESMEYGHVGGIETDLLGERQHRVLRGDRRLQFLVEEAALHRQVGGPLTMKQQLTFVAEHISRNSALEFRILPFSRGAAGAFSQAFALFQFTRSSSGLIFRGVAPKITAANDEFAQASGRFGALWRLAATASESRQMIMRELGQLQ
jgi:transcriptional regulator with XRE-family HTH domain